LKPESQLTKYLRNVSDAYFPIGWRVIEMVIWLGSSRSSGDARAHRSAVREFQRLDACLLRDLAISEAEIECLIENQEPMRPAVRSHAIQAYSRMGMWMRGGFERRSSRIATAKKQ
jgi:hypothetical protein